MNKWTLLVLLLIANFSIAYADSYPVGAWLGYNAETGKFIPVAMNASGSALVEGIGSVPESYYKSAIDTANEEVSADFDAAAALVTSNYTDINASIASKGVDMTGVKPSGYASKIAGIQGATWERPAFWPAMPDISGESDVFVGLHAVFPGDANFVAVAVSGAWVFEVYDGETLIHSANVNNNARYDYNFNFSDFAGAANERGYKVAIVKIKPQLGKTLVNINLQQQHASTAQSYILGWLDINVKCPAITMFTIGAASAGQRAAMLESIVFSEHSNFALSLDQCNSLQNAVFDTAKINGLSTLYASCNLRKAPQILLPPVAAANAYYSAFSSALVENFENLDLSFATGNVGKLFYLSQIRRIGSIDLQSATDVTEAFRGSSLQYLGYADLRSATNVTGLLRECAVLKSADLRLDAATTTTSMVSGCRSLIYLRLRNLKVTTTVANCQLGFNALKTIIENDLYPGVSSQTFTITGNPGASAVMAAISAGTITVPTGWTIAN